MSKEFIHTTGRRKTASAKIFLVSNSNFNIVVNDYEFNKYIHGFTHYILEPLLIVDNFNFNIKCVVKGGGISGQALAIQHGISRALGIYKDSYRYLLRKSHLITRDSRIVERKKYGQAKARKKFQFSKR